MTSDPQLAARSAALKLLEAALARRTGLDEALMGPAMSKLAARERAFARAVAMAALRRLGPIDKALAGKLTRPPPDPVRNILRLGAAQAFWLEVPEFAAVATSVELAAAGKGTRPFKGLVNAVLRGLLREGPPAATPEDLAPPWLFARWRAAYGEAAAKAIGAMIAEEPATDLTFKTAADAERLAPELEADALPGGSLRTARRGDLAEWPGFDEGAWWVQDASAAIPARLLDVQPGESALDLCAAPGGKTLQLAAAGAQVVAVDRSGPRLRRLSANLDRTRLKAEVVVADAADWRDPRTFHAVLLDAPCTATGTFRRHPDVLWAAKPGEVASLSAVQTKLLSSAADRVKPGGRLVYCVCSLEPEEGEAQLARFLAARPDYSLMPIRAGEGGAPEQSVRPDGTLRILPHHLPGGGDGFFVARLTRSAALPVSGGAG
ncbi:RsmB/NOP family class I SAM-dependent RNA methyltransferase [Phenylobacterium sp.]|uniref:RsmB/NOP family class I SAM-dependent RNA methyltransferase n=1 Tax=Phenylobacterium sp. TaxID=1871053 RepID=UPI002E359FE3|nr:RsmB/NOP family class I SAM-dependent RNA methyltransferase [Phenylobacterium sp.]HEX2560074.1 RsmB/NOP family class I SAM-dependent RNA methyltransferase [Phenylobacterium sp.]